MKTKKSYWAMLLVCLTLMPACKTSRAVKGGVIGGAAGGVIGGVIGKKAGNTVVGVIIGAAVGGTAGVLIGRYMDKQAEEIRKDMKGAQVERVGEGILITFDSGLLFGVDSYQLNQNTRSNLNQLSDILAKYEDTDILIEGHTDNTGTEDHNQTLSENRAKSVSGYLIQRGVVFNRFTTVGYGENQPVADNATAAGRQENRRVEVAITANKKLKKAAKRGDIGT
ncbi:MAG: OmpA family protein [Lewinellaceae bacterium]|nr:OmpA family protein [Lewinella sp.]MCB9277824.1 OmpA family protein [Lewinellaceae bacterium]